MSTKTSSPSRDQSDSISQSSTQEIRHGNAADATLLSLRASLAQGQAIGKLMAQALAHPNFISLAAGFVDNATLPCEAVQECLSHVASTPNALRQSLQYDTTAGNRELRETISQWSYRETPDARPCSERILITSGSNQFLHLISEAIVDPGDIVLVAAPTYFVYLGTLRGIGARVIGIPADEDGIVVDSIQSCLEKLAKEGMADRVKAIYTVTEFDNPAGSTLSLQRRQELLELVARWRREQGPLLILSDNAYQLLRYQGESLPPLLALHENASDFVVELGTFSKSFSPGIRVGWGVVPQWMTSHLLDMKSNIDFGSPHFSQAVMQKAVADGYVDRHLPVIRSGYQVKLTATLDALDKHFGSHPDVHWRVPQGGLYVWVTFPEHIDTSESGPLWDACMEREVLYVPGHHCVPSELAESADQASGMCSSIRLSFGVQDAASIDQGVQKIAEAFEAVRGN